MWVEETEGEKLSSIKTFINHSDAGMCVSLRERQAERDRQINTRRERYTY